MPTEREARRVRSTGITIEAKPSAVGKRDEVMRAVKRSGTKNFERGCKRKTNKKLTYT